MFYLSNFLLTMVLVEKEYIYLGSGSIFYY